ncbi:MAG: hypothetical protein SFY66_20695 [Oculatellaceae cyanobacterium bins.114]|nr:hypothetical protein [Oculatellaceae cyanobacterium bins.114]
MVTTPVKPNSQVDSRDVEVILPNVVPRSTPCASTFAVIDVPSVEVLPHPQTVDLLNQKLRSPSPLSRNRWVKSLKQHQTVAIAGVAIAVSSTGLAEVLTPSNPDYEGRFYLATSEVETDAVETVAQSQSYSAIAPPAMSLEQHTAVLTSPALLEPAIAQLQAEGIEIDYQSLVNNLKVAPTSTSNVLEVSYQTKDTQHLQAILDKVAEVYTSDSQSCVTQTCQNLEHLTTQISSVQARIKTLQSNLNHFQQQNQIPNLQAQHQQTLVLKTQLNRQIEQNQAKLDAVRRQVERLTAQLQPQAHPFSAADLLAQNAHYQLLMEQLKSVESLIAEELQHPQIQQNNLQPLYEQYQALVVKLNEETNTISVQFIVNHVIGQPTPLASQLSDVQRWIEMTHQAEILGLHQQKLMQLDQNLNQRIDQSTTVLEQYAHLERQLQDANTLLAQYSTQHQELQTIVASEKSWNLVSPPEILQTQLRQPQAFIPDQKHSVGMGLLLGALLGVGVAALTEGSGDVKAGTALRRQARIKLNPKV